MSQKIIGITGTLGAGKGTVVEILASKYAFAHYSVRAYLSAEATKRNMPIDRGSLLSLANEFRAENGPSFIMEELYREASAAAQNAVIESVRTTGEIDFLRSVKNFSLLAVDADPRLRYDRIMARASETDRISFAEFLADELRESTSLDSDKPNLPACIALADKLVINDGSIADLEKGIVEAMRKF